MYIDDSGYLRAGANSSPACQAVSNGTVNDGQWHHVALSANEDVHDLYVDGTRTEATCGMSPLDGQLGWSAFGTGYTAIAGGYWPGTHQDVSPYEGFLDDVRLFARDLTDADVTSLRARPAANAFAHWDFGQVSGNVLPDVTGHSKDGVVTGGNWRPSEHGGALEFDENTRVDLPLDVMQNQPITVSTWINTTKPGTILGNQRGAYPNKPGTGWYLDGFGIPQSVQALFVDEQGKPHSTIGGVEAVGAANLRDGQWHHIVVTVTAAAAADQPLIATIYVGGQQVGSGTDVYHPLNAFQRTNNQWGAGLDDHNEWQHYSGMLGDTQVFNEVLDNSAIRELAR
jgi:hypothetical protein